MFAHVIAVRRILHERRICFEDMAEKARQGTCERRDVADDPLAAEVFLGDARDGVGEAPFSGCEVVDAVPHARMGQQERT